jgi:heme exporter protein A
MALHSQASTFSLKQLAFARNERVLFENIDIRLAAGSLLQLHGANGAGKSTLLRLCAGYIEPTAGNIFWQKQCISKQRSEFQTHVHYLGHQNGLKPQLTVMENLNLASALAGKKFVANAALEILEQLHCANIANLQTRYLSAGQCRRAALARLALNPRQLWLLDEPVTALDGMGQKLLMDLLAAHASAGGIALMATHQVLTDITSLALGEYHA